MVNPSRRRSLRLRLSRFGAEAGLFMLAALVVSQSAFLAKRSVGAMALVALDDGAAVSLAMGTTESAAPATSPIRELPDVGDDDVLIEEGPVTMTPPEGFQRYFDGRPIRPVKTMWMTVTAYSPDERSCDQWADGYTATNHSVWTNAMRLVAADTNLLPFGSMVSVPGYAEGEVVPVLDRGGAIKGRRLDVLYPTHEVARKWGRQRLQVTVWEFADGKPNTLGVRKRG
ncbi:MAG: 3D domain-containing protein [Phycisphaerae bacterium]|nr:3D domain-containing protein [Phycisphaerae bacterium]